MKYVKVTFDNGDHLTTNINGSLAEITEYYKIGRTFNIGDGAGGDLLTIVSKLEFIK